MESTFVSLRNCLRRSIINNNIYSIIFLVGSANNVSQQYPAYIDKLAEKAKSVNKTVFVYNIDPVLEETPLFSKNLVNPVYIKKENWDQYIVGNLRFLSFRTCLNVSSQCDEDHMSFLNTIVETCMDNDIMFLYSAFTGIDSYILHDRMFSVYGHDERFNRYIDFGSIITYSDYSTMLTTCMCDPNTTPPIFSPDMDRIYSIDSMEISKIVELRNMFPNNEHLKSKIKNVLLRKVKHCLETDGVILRNYVVGNSTCVSPHILQGYDLPDSLNMEPFCMVRDYLLTFGDLIANPDTRAIYMYCVHDIVNMTKENRYTWFDMMKNVFVN